MIRFSLWLIQPVCLYYYFNSIQWRNDYVRMQLQIDRLLLQRDFQMFRWCDTQIWWKITEWMPHLTKSIEYQYVIQSVDIWCNALCAETYWARLVHSPPSNKLNLSRRNKIRHRKNAASFFVVVKKNCNEHVSDAAFSTLGRNQQTSEDSQFSMSRGSKADTLCV